MAKKFKQFSNEQRIIDNPLLYIAQGISPSRDGQVWEQKPVEMEEFIESKKHLNQKWNGRSGCRPKIKDILIKAMDSKTREMILLLGKGSGKDYLSSILHLYGIHRCLCMLNPQAFFGLSPTPMYFVNTARNDKQAKKVFFAQFIALLKDTPWFEGKFREPGVDTVTFDKNIQALSVNSQAFGWLGYNTIQWVGDELAFFLENDQDDESESRAEECWQAAYGSCKTRFPKDYKMIGITTPRYDDDFVMKKFHELSNREDGYTEQAATWDINPNLTKEDFKHEMIRDYRRTMRDFGAQPVGVIESFWPDPSNMEDYCCETCHQCPVFQRRKELGDIHSCLEFADCKMNAYKGNGYWHDWFRPPQDNNSYWMHFDLAKSRDRIGFCLGRSVGEVKIEMDSYKLKEMLEKNKDIDVTDLSEDDRYQTKPLIKMEAVGWISTGTDRNPRMLKNGEFYYKAILDFLIMYLLNKGFVIEGCSFDQFNSHFIKQELEDKGIRVELISCDRTDEVPSNAKYAVIEQRVEYPYSWLLCDEAKHLKTIEGKKVDHAKKKSKDVWDAFASTIVACEKFLNCAGGYVMLGDEDD